MARSRLRCCTGERLVEQHLLRAFGLGQQADFFDLAAPDEQCRVRRRPLAGQARHRLHARGFGQQAQLDQFAIEVRHTQVNPDQHDTGVRRSVGG